MSASNCRPPSIRLLAGFQTVAADYLEFQLSTRAVCALGFWDCTPTFGCTGPAALLAGRGPLLLALAPLFWGVWVSICAPEMDLPPGDAAALAWQQRVSRHARVAVPVAVPAQVFQGVWVPVCVAGLP